MAKRKYKKRKKRVKKATEQSLYLQWCSVHFHYYNYISEYRKNSFDQQRIEEFHP